MNKYQRFRKRPQRRGVAIIVVLGLISIAMALSYTMMRAQGTTLTIQQNSRRRTDARQAALSGLMAGLGHMHQADWVGVGGTLTGRLSETESYTVVYSTGDTQLGPTDPHFAEWPYRVTLLVTGFTASENGGATSTHVLRAVARLNPQGLSPAPPDWLQMQQYSIYQWTAGDFSIDVPARIEGPVWMQGALRLAETYPSTSSSRRRYLSDLNAMRAAGRPDYRPLAGPVHWRAIQSSGMVDLLTQASGVSTETIEEATADGWDHPGPIKTYRLYAGGEEYAIPRIPETLENISLAPDPKLNPLGIFLREGSVELRGNVSVTGQIISTSDVRISGENVRLAAAELPAINDSGEPVRLPALVVGDDFRVYSGAEAIVQGNVLAWDETEIREGTDTTQWELKGRLVSKQFTIGPRTQWNFGYSGWSTLYSLFQWQLNQPQHVSYFPDYVSLLGRRPTPKIRFTPDTTPRIEHFPNLGQPVYGPAAGDAGLRWDLLGWKDANSNAPATDN